jgi:glucokinase
LTLEELASGPALVRRYNRRAPAPVDSARQVMEALRGGDEIARAVVHQAADMLGMGIALYVDLLDPEAIVVGGGLGLAGGEYWNWVVAAARANIWAENARQLPILPAALGAESGVIGAAALAWKQFTNE